MSFKKRWFKSIFGLTGILVMTLNAKAAVVGTVNTDQLNVRQAPVQVTGNIISQLDMSQQVHILDVDKGYYEILFNDSVSYVKQEYVDYMGVPGSVNTDVNIRRKPEQATDNIIVTVKAGETVYVLEYGDTYCYVRYGEEEGYAYTDHLAIDVEDKKSITALMNTKNAKIVATDLNVRSEASTSAGVLTQLDYGMEVDVLELSGDWVQIRLDDGSKGYVHKAYVQVVDALDMDSSNETMATDLGRQIADFGISQLGTPYVYGGTSLTYGVDCSGFTQGVYKQFGIEISRTSRTQIYDGMSVSLSELQPGDLIFYGYNGYISHVSLYIGNGQVVHSSTPRTGVIISGVYANSKPVIGATRIITN